MTVYKCKMCGGDLEVSEGLTVVACEYCGTSQTVPSAKDESLQGLFNRANTLRIKSEFDKAEQLYEKIVQKDETQAEAYWGLILCRNGIEYVEDPETFKRIPTCHRASFDSIIADEDYKSALKYADSIQRTIYEQEAKEIDRIQKEILELSKKEEPYDVFICYKETDETGKRTQDSVIANDIYYQLTQEGFKVFYAAITLEDKLGSAYEPCIFAALNSAKVMLSIGTKPEFFNAVWVKNEWSRFLKLMKKDRSKILIPCYRDMDAYELPEEFAHLQAQDMSKIGFINDIVRGIKKVVSHDEKTTEPVRETISLTTNANIAPLLKRAFMFLEDGDWQSADEYCEKVLDIEPECAEAYLGKLMAELKIKKQEDLKNCEKTFDTQSNYQKIMRFGDEKLTTTLGEYIKIINDRNEEMRLYGIYSKAVHQMNTATTEENFESAADTFKKILEYRDAKPLFEKCIKEAELAKKDVLYKKYLEIFQGLVSSTIKNWEAALLGFNNLGDYKDSRQRAEQCSQMIEDLKAKAEQERIEKERLAEQARIEREQERIEKERQAELAKVEAKRIAKRNKKIASIAMPIVCVVVAIVVLLNTVIIPNVKYNNAIKLMDLKEYSEAYGIFRKLGSYRDSENKAVLCIPEMLKMANIGDSVFLGAYEQDNDNKNGAETIEWLVLDKHDNRVLVISKYALDSKQYNTKYTEVTWMTSSLRYWLNSDFIFSAFSKEERKMIPTVTVSDAQDKVFLLSISEANKYFSSDDERLCEPTAYADDEGVYVKGNYCWWWLRSSDHEQYNAPGVNYHGGVYESSNPVQNGGNAVRPAMWIEIK